MIENLKTLNFLILSGKLVLAIPWKNLYTESTVVDIQDLHLVAKPNFGNFFLEKKIIMSN